MVADGLNTSKDRGHTSGGVVLFALGGAISATLALALWALGYLESQPIGFGPGADPGQEAGPHPYASLVAVWAAAAVTEIVCAALLPRRPRTAVALVIAAIAAGFVATRAAAPEAFNLLPVPVAVIAWLVPVVPLAIGVVAALQIRLPKSGV